MKKITMGAAAGYWGTPLDLPRELAERTKLDYIGIELLAEISMSILQRWTDRDPKMGFVPDLTEMLRFILPPAVKNGTKIITNGGGTNPKQAAIEVAKLLKELNLPPLKIAYIEGEDVKDKIADVLAKGHQLVNLDTGEKDISVIQDKIVAAHAYIGADKIVEALEMGADIVIGGRLSDNALYVGPIMHEFGYKFEEPYWEKIGAAITTGHIIECGECVTGGMSNFWEHNPEPWNIGLPIAEVYENGDAIITMTPDTGGHVSVNTVREHLVYEVHDPFNYLMPDGIANLASAKLEQLGKNKVKVTNMTGKKRPDTLKVQIGYKESWIAEAETILPWPQALTKAKLHEKIVRKRMEKFNLQPLELNFEWIGLNCVHGVTAPIPEDEDMINEILLRCSAKFETRKDAETARRQVLGSLICSPVGAAFGVPRRVRRVIGLWPTLMPREDVELTVTMMEEN